MANSEESKGGLRLVKSRARNENDPTAKEAPTIDFKATALKVRHSKTLSYFLSTWGHSFDSIYGSRTLGWKVGYSYSQSFISIVDEDKALPISEEIIESLSTATTYAELHTACEKCGLSCIMRVVFFDVLMMPAHPLSKLNEPTEAFLEGFLYYFQKGLSPKFVLGDN